MKKIIWKLVSPYQTYGHQRWILISEIEAVQMMKYGEISKISEEKFPSVILS